MTHQVQAGDLVRVEYLLGRSLQFFVYGLVMFSEGADVHIDATYIAEVPVQFDTIVVPGDQIAPGADPVLIDHGYARLAPGESFGLELTLDLAALP